MSDLALDVITLGESMALFVSQAVGPLAEVDHFQKRIAGAETNVAIGLARLGLRVAWVSRLGSDSFGQFVLRTVMHEGVDCGHVVIDLQRPTGFMLKSRAVDGADPAVEYFRGGSAASALSLQDFDERFFRTARHLHVTGITPALSPGAAELVEYSMRFMRQVGRTVSFDPNLRPVLWSSQKAMVEQVNRLAAAAHWVLPGLNEGQALTGLEMPTEVASFYLNQGAEAVVIKLGAQGAFYRTADEEQWVTGVPVPRVIDTVGAGDGFAVGVISARLEGLPWPVAVARGNWIGAQAIQVLGDMEGLPRRHQLPQRT